LGCSSDNDYDGITLLPTSYAEKRTPITDRNAGWPLSMPPTFCT
jgi:hypothetical protein